MQVEVHLQMHKLVLQEQEDLNTLLVILQMIHYQSSSDNDAEFNLYLFDIRMFTQIQLSANFGGSPNAQITQGTK